MRKFFLKTAMLFLAMTAFNVHLCAQQSHPNIYGFLRYSNASEINTGIYTISPENGGTVTSYWIDAEMIGNGGAVYANNKYYILSFMDFGGGMLFGSYLMCDIDAKTYDYITPELDISYIASDLTYDATNNTVYACSMDISGDGTFWLSRMDIATGAKEGIAKMPHMAAIAANAEGVLYGIGMDGILYTIDKNTAALTEIGSTGISPINDQSATFDPETGILYWSAYTEKGGALYTVDTATGAATLYCNYPNGEQITGLFIKPDAVAEGKPASAENMTFDFKNDELSGTVSFTLPSFDVEGKPLTGKLFYGLSVDNGEFTEKTGNPGEVVTYTLENLSEGTHMFVASVRNDAGAATPLNEYRYIGMDTPQSPVNVVAKVEGNSIVLTWDIPEVGENSGYVDKANMRYNILRKYDNVMVATDLGGNTFTDTFTDTNIRICNYEIEPFIGKHYGKAASSGDVTIGEYMNVPFEHDLANVGDYMLYTVFDANADKDSWIFGVYPDFSDNTPCATYLWTPSPTNDDWLFTPYMYLEAGKTYEAKYSLRGESDVYAGDIEIMLGKEKKAEGMTTVLERQPVDYSDFRWLTTESFTVQESGKYVLGLHVCGSRSKYYIYLNGVNVYENDKTDISSASVLPDVYVRDGAVCIENISGEQVNVYDAAGVSVLRTTEKNVELKVPAGLYIVRVGSSTVKLMVK